MLTEKVYDDKKKRIKWESLKKTGSTFINTMQDISIGIETRMWVRRPTNHRLFPSCNKRHLSVSVSRVTTPLPQAVNLLVFEINHSPTSSIKLTIHGSIRPLPPCAYMARCLNHYRFNFTFMFHAAKTGRDIDTNSVFIRPTNARNFYKIIYNYTNCSNMFRFT